MFKNFKQQAGCILADDMGLGKTVQVSVLVTTLILQNLVERAIIVVPATLLDYWESEIVRWIPYIKNLPDFKEKYSQYKKVMRI